MPGDELTDDQRWAMYLSNTTEYQKMVLIAALIGALEFTKNERYTADTLIDYFEEVMFQEQTRNLKEN